MAETTRETLTPTAWNQSEALIVALCEAVGLVPGYCDRVDVEMGRVTFHLFAGRDGRCQGPKYVIGSESDPVSYGPLDPVPENWGEAAREVVVFECPPGPPVNLAAPVADAA